MLVGFLFIKLILLARGLTHASTAEDGGVSVRLDTNAENIDAGGVDIDGRAKVGEVGADVVLSIESADSNGTGGRTGRGVGSVLLWDSQYGSLLILEKNSNSVTYVLVTSSNDGDNTSSDNSIDGTVDCLGETTTQGHVHDSLATNTALLAVVNNELHALEDIRVLATSISTEDTDSNEVDLLGNTESSTANGAGDVASVAVLISHDIVVEVGAESGTALEFSVSDPDTGVDNVGSDTFASGVVKDIVVGAGFGVRNAVKTRRRVGLGDGGVGGNLGIGLNPVDLVRLRKGVNHVIFGVENSGAPVVHSHGVDGGRERLAGGG